MRTPTLIFLATLLALPLAASAQIYSWKDASGKVHYSDKPPLEKKVQTRELMSGKTTGEAPAVQGKAGDGVVATKRDEAGNGETKDKSPEQQRAEADARQQLCDNARKRLIQLETSPAIIVSKNEQGQDVPLVGEARKSQADAARKDVEQWCK